MIAFDKIFLYLFVFCWFSAAYAVGDTDASLYRIPFVNESGLILLDGKVGDEEGYFIFDTGADAVLLDIKLNPSESTLSSTFNSLGGNLKAASSDINSIDIGDYSMHELECYAADLGHLTSFVGYQLLGIVGIELFGDRILHVDNVRKELVIYNKIEEVHKSGSSYNTIQIDIEIENNLLFVPLTIEGSTYNFLLDTGASASLIDNNVLSNLLSAKTSLTNFSLHTTDGTSSTLDIYNLPHVYIDKLRVDNFQFGAMDMSISFDQFSSYKYAGVLSLRQLPISEFTIDVKNKMIILSV